MLEEPAISSGSGEEAADQIVNIRLAESQRLCFDVSNAPKAGKPGMEWHLWDCPPAPTLWDEFEIPLHGHVGPIKPLKYPNFCLGKRGTQPVSFQPCDTLPLSLMLWMVNTDKVTNYQRLHFAADVSQCLGVNFAGDIASTRGEVVRLQKCAEADAAGGQILLIQPTPVDCIWVDWTSWSTCSRLCGVGNTVRSRTIFRKALYEGEICEGGWKQQKICHGTGCPGGPPEDEEVGPPGAWYANPWFVHVLAFLAIVLCCCLSVFLLKKFRIRMVLVDQQRKEGPEDDDELSEGDSRMGLLHAPGNSRVSPEARLASLRGELPGAGRSGGTPPARAPQREVQVQAWQPDSSSVLPADGTQLAGQFDSGVQTTVATCRKGHELKEVVGAQAKKRWSCDAQWRSAGDAQAAAGCPHGRASLGKHGVRYRCDECDFDLCDKCYTRQLAGQQGASLPTSPGSGRAPVSPASERSERGSPGSSGAARSSLGGRWNGQQRGESQDRQLVDLGPGCTASVPSPPRSAGTRGSGSPSGAQSPQSRGTASPS